MSNEPQEPFDEEEDDFVSKTAVKKALQEIVIFSEGLLEASPKVLTQLPLSDSIIKEIELAKTLKVNNSRRRQLQRIAKLLRADNIEEVRIAFDALQAQDRQHQQSISISDSWCERLLSDSESLAEFIEKYPQTERQQLSQALRNAKKEKDNKEKEREQEKQQENASKNPKKKPNKKYQQRLFELVQQILIEKD